MSAPLASPPHRTVDQLRSLVRLAVVALRRTAFENSTQLLAAGAAVVVLADGAGRVRNSGALDRWLIAALTATMVLPAVLTGNDPLRSQRLALLPVPSSILGRARVIASAPLRWPLAVLLLIIGIGPAFRVSSGAAALALVGWSVAAFFAGAVLEEHWHRPRAVVVRVFGTALAGVGAGCLWSLRDTTPTLAARAQTWWFPPLLPRDEAAADWLIALATIASSVALGALVMNAPRQRVRHAAPPGPTADRARTWQVGRALSEASFSRFVRPVIARELALLSRHVAPRVSLALTAALACAASYGRVPGLALVAIAPIIMLTANLLGADVAMGGLVRHRLHPDSLTAIRDRRLTVWSVSAALAAVLGACVGLVLPVPTSAGQPVAGVFGAPAMLLYAVALIPWFGRATWWWARRYPRPFAQRVTEAGAPAPNSPMGSAHLALALYVAWAGVALLAAVLWAACYAMADAVLTRVLLVELPMNITDRISWISASLLGAGVAGGAHVAYSARATPAPETNMVQSAEAAH